MVLCFFLILSFFTNLSIVFLTLVFSFNVRHYACLRFPFSMVVALHRRHSHDNAIQCFTNYISFLGAITQGYHIINGKHMHFSFPSALPSSPTIPHLSSGFNISTIASCIKSSFTFGLAGYPEFFQLFQGCASSVPVEQYTAELFVSVSHGSFSSFFPKLQAKIQSRNSTNVMPFSLIHILTITDQFINSSSKSWAISTFLLESRSHIQKQINIFYNSSCFSQSKRPRRSFVPSLSSEQLVWYFSNAAISKNGFTMLLVLQSCLSETTCLSHLPYMTADFGRTLMTHLK